MRKGYIVWNYRRADTAWMDELPEDFADYVPDAARYRERIAAGDTPIEAALKELMATNAFNEREIETCKKLLAGWEYAEATGLIVRTDVPSKPRPNVTTIREGGGCLWSALVFIIVGALVTAGAVALEAAGPYLERVATLVAGWALGDPLVAVVALIVVAAMAFCWLARKMDEDSDQP